MARWALAVEQGQEPREGAISGLEVGTRKGALCPAEPPCPPTHSSLCCQMFFSGGPRWDPPVLCFESRVWQDPQQVPVPGPSMLQALPSMEGRGRGVISHTHSGNPNLFSVPYSAPLSPLCVPPSTAPARPFHIPALCPAPVICSWIVAVSVPCRLQQPCKALLNSLSPGHRFLQGTDKILQV